MAQRPPYDTALTAADANDLYGVDTWAAGYFEVGDDGDMHVRIGDVHASLPMIVARLEASGRRLPMIVRFPQILEDRLARVNGAFESAMEEAGYRGRYQGVYPIKVNQRRVVVETLAEAGAPWRTGLEAGSKAELALILVQDTHPDALIQCNGFKDDDFVRLALWGRKLGKNVTITLEKFGELDRVLRIADELGVEPAIGLRYKIHARGSGAWESSGGDDAKFGLTSGELLAVAERLKADGREGCLAMLHAHVGSQITDIRKIRVAVREAAQTYVELCELGTCPRYLNLGGGLAVDYDGSKTTFAASANYGLRTYAEALVYTVAEACDQAEVAHPVLVTESGRALTAHHAVAVVPVIDAIGRTRDPVELPPLPPEPNSLVGDMEELLDGVTVKTYRQVYYEAVSNKDTMHQLFDLGYLSLVERAHVERLYNRILSRVAKVISGLDYVPEELEDLDGWLADTYVANFSLFQTLPDHWAIQQLFPIAPLHRLNERPTRRATVADISCDSDGKISKFIDLRDVARTLPVHDLRDGQPYLLGLFLTGAYQDVLANAHNLFGRVNEAHVRLGPDGAIVVERFVGGQKARRVIENMGYRTDALLGWLDQEIAEAKAHGTVLTEEDEADLRELYEHELVGYTYLE
ncbi:MAG: biosynthetic arginine decarboxylase [Trueperaceae bacterium]